MHAVMKTGGKQYRVQAGDVLRVERIAADAGETVQFNEVLMVGGSVGTPFVDGAGVQAEVIDQIKGDKVIHFVKRRRKHSSKRTKGHRQNLTLVRITDILESGAGDTGVKAAIGSGIAGWTAAPTEPARYTTNRAEQADMKARVADGEAKEKPVSAPESVAAEDAQRPGNLLTEAREGGPDDLKKISGVGPKLEGVLHDNGVFHFDQIAAWGPEEIAYMNDKLSFKGRIERDNWIEQAEKFAAEKG
ncbi:MAG: 50S ribosomal protein L21 [Shimia sp.]